MLFPVGVHKLSSFKGSYNRFFCFPKCNPFFLVKSSSRYRIFYCTIVLYIFRTLYEWLGFVDNYGVIKEILYKGSLLLFTKYCH